MAHYSTYRSSYSSPRSSSLSRFNSSARSTFNPYWMLEENEAKNTENYLLRLVDDTGSEEVSDEVYVEKMNRILTGPPFIGVPPEPSLLVNGVYIGTQAQGENPELLRRMRITHVLNCAGLRTTQGLKSKKVLQYRKQGITYEELPLEDREHFEIFGYFDTTHSFIEHGSMTGRVLICDAGVSRSGAIALAYLLRRGRTLLKATQELKDLRRVVLCNTGFMEQLVRFARTLGMLDPNPGDVRSPRYGREIDRARIMSAHLPIIL